MYGDWCLCVDYDYLCMRLLHLLKCYFACFNNFALFVTLSPNLVTIIFLVRLLSLPFNLSLTSIFFFKKKRGHLLGFEFFFFFFTQFDFFLVIFKKNGITKYNISTKNK